MATRARSPVFSFSTILVIFIHVVTQLPFANAQLHPHEPSKYHAFPPLREQARLLDEWRKERLERLPDLMERFGVDVWLMSMRELAEDPIWWTIKSATEFNAHRRTVVLFHRGSITSNTTSTATLPNPLIWIDNTDSVWEPLNAALASLNPRTIVINAHRDIAHAGGIRSGELEVLMDRLDEGWVQRFFQTPPMMVVEFVGRRVDVGLEVEGGRNSVLEWYRKLEETTWAIVEEAFSERVVRPGMTTTDDISWWMRDKIQSLNLTTWNQPRVSVITPESFPGWSGTYSVVQEGDILHVDFGVTGMGLNTDIQHLGYVLPSTIVLDKLDSESGLYKEVPEGIREGMRKANGLQDIVLREMKPFRSGNEVLKACNDAMEREGIEGQVFCHPIGDYGHAPGATIGFTNLPTFVPIFGELPLLPNTFYSIELFASHFVPERNETLRFMLEDNAYWNEEKQGWEFVRGRQERFHIVNTRRYRSTTQRTVNFVQQAP